MGEVAEFSKGQGYSKADLCSSGIPAFLYGQMYTDYKLLVTESDQHLPQNSDGVFSTAGDVIIPASGESPEEIAIASVIGKTGILLGGDLNIIKPEKSILDSIFLALSASGGRLHGSLVSRAQGKTIVHLHNSDIAASQIRYPTLPEQRRIGTFFSALDSLIAAAERQEALLKQKKQAYLQLMFPQEGETEPRLRFAGFSGEWETRQLGEVAEVHNGRDYKHLQPGNIPVYGTSGYMLSVDDALSWNDDAVGIGRKGTIDKPCILRAPFWTVDTLFFVTPRPSTPLEFLFALFESVNWKSKDESTGVPSLTKQAIVNTAVKVPDTSEQHQIGVFFTQIDNIIAIAEEQAKALRAMKRAYSQRMFI